MLDGEEARYQLISPKQDHRAWSRILQFLPAQGRDTVLGTVFVLQMST